MPVGAMWVIAAVGEVPCQCLIVGGAPDDVAELDLLDGSASCWARPMHSVTIRRCPAGWTCHADRAPGRKVTYAPLYDAISSVANSGWTRHVPGEVLGWSFGWRL
jgi:hypothetical protein